MVNLDDHARSLLQEIYYHLRGTGEFPEVAGFRVSHETDRSLLDDLKQEGFLVVPSGRYQLTTKGLRACDTDETRKEFENFAALIPVLQDCYREGFRKNWTSNEIAARSGTDLSELDRTLTLFKEAIPISQSGRDSAGAHVLRLREEVLDLNPNEWAPGSLTGFPEAQKSLELRTLAIDGYRLFKGFTAELNSLTVIIGANASGKSSLFDFLRFLRFASTNSLPPEIDPGSEGKTFFNVDGPARMSFELVVGPASEKTFHYNASLEGIGNPRILRETLSTYKPPEGLPVKFPFLDFTRGKGEIRDPAFLGFGSQKITLKPNELAITRAVHPQMKFISAFRDFLSSIVVYSGLNLARSSKLGLPVLTQPGAVLASDCSNLSAVLLSMVTEHPNLLGDLEAHLGSVIPGFESLRVKAKGGRGTVTALWREQGVTEDLALSDLSDGTLRLLCWTVLCLSPSLPSLVCIDEPELGLHPRALPMLAGLFKTASARSQVLVATHSPYLLSQFSLDENEIAVMKREMGGPVFRRPGDRTDLRNEIKELGGDELARMHVSDELESRS